MSVGEIWVMCDDWQREISGGTNSIRQLISVGGVYFSCVGLSC
jgi:hypothetical protein